MLTRKTSTQETKQKTKTSLVEAVKKSEASCAPGRNVGWCGHLRTQTVTSLTAKHGRALNSKFHF